MSGTVPLCEQKQVWEMDGTTVTQYTECAEDAVGRYRYTDPHGAEGEFVWCEDHAPEDAELIESFGNGEEVGPGGEP